MRLWRAFAWLATMGLAHASWGAALPSPDGPFGVGVMRAEFSDAARRLNPEDPLSGPRRMPAWVWYPAEVRGGGDAPYLSAPTAASTLAALGRIFRFSEADLLPLAQARLAVQTGAKPMQRAGAFPVVLFSHGLLLYPEQNSALAARLASHGYIVVSIAHPLDAADQVLEDGRLIASDFSTAKDDPRFLGAFQVLVAGAGLEDRKTSLKTYADSIGSTRLGRSVDEWQADTLAVARDIVEGKEPASLHSVLASADRTKLAFAGMSFGGATSATSCRQIVACRAAVNLDGQNFDPQLFDAPVGRPLLLMLSDWTRYSLFKDQTRGEDFSPNDLAYEPWSSAGSDPNLWRVRMKGSRHMAFTDFAALLEGEARQARIGDIGAAESLSAVNDLVLAFLDVHLRSSPVGRIERVMKQHPSLERHLPVRVKAWSAP